MPKAFFAGQVRLLHKRSLILLEHLRSHTHLKPEVQTHVERLELHLQSISLGLEAMLNDPDFGAEVLLRNQFDDYKRFAELLAAFEYEPLALLDHFNDRDLRFCRFANKFCEQIGYQDLPPLVSAHSNEYFYSRPYLNLIRVPLNEGHHLLALPDFAHELGHIVWVKVYKNFLAAFSRKLSKYIKRLKTKAINQAASAAYQQHFALLEDVWKERYVIEFFCDMFATYLVGAAFGWSHLRLVLSSSSGIYYPGFGETTTHPADEARMRGVLLMLEELNDQRNADAIAAKWESFKTILPDLPDNEYVFCYPDELLREVAAQVIAVCQRLKLKAFHEQPSSEDNLPALMLLAWEVYHQDPNAYVEWEADRVCKLDLLLSPAN
jgi:hypothetical protein